MKDKYGCLFLMNVSFDYQSRNFQQETEWILNAKLFKEVMEMVGFTPEIGMFCI